MDEENYLAKRRESFTEKELDALYAIAGYEGYGKSKDMINLTVNLNCYTLIQNIGNMSRAGRHRLVAILINHGGDTAEKGGYKASKRNIR